MTATHAEILDALDGIAEPCSIAMDTPETLVSMGLVESVTVADAHVDVCLVLTDPSCVHFMSMRRYITDTLCARDDVDSVHVRMSTTQLWTPDRMHPGRAHTTSPSVGRQLLPLI